MSHPTDQQPESSMEDILSSIRRILSSDEEEKASEAVIETKSADMEQPMEALELTEVVDDDDDTMDEPISEVTRAPTSALEIVERPDPSNTFMSQDTLSASTSALSSLKEVLEPKEEKSSDSIEDLAKSLLQPLLREWVDQNLPDLVERVVREEIQKLTESS